MRIFHDIEGRSNLYFLLNAFIGAYNRRTDVMHAQVDPEALKLLTAKLKASSDNLAAAVKSQTPKEK
jgi:hypothetical protein